MPLPNGLLQSVKNYLYITWDITENETEKLEGIIKRGIAYIDGVAGEKLDYTVEEKAKELLLDYCRYTQSNALDEFMLNYLHELLSLQMAVEIANHIGGDGGD